MWMPLNLSKFKKIASDKDTSTLRHENGHEIKLVHKQLSPTMRKQLQAIPAHKGSEKSSYDGKGSIRAPKGAISGKSKDAIRMDDGGNVPQTSPSPDPSSHPNKDNPHYDQQSADKVHASLSKAFGFADGGEVSDDQALAQKAQEDKANRQRMDQGEEQQDYSAPVQKVMSKGKNVQQGEMHYLADGGEPEAAPMPINTQAAPQLPQGMLASSQPNAIPDAEAGEIPAAGAEQAPKAIADAKLSEAKSPEQVKDAVKGESKGDMYGTQALYDAYSKGLTDQTTGIQSQANAEAAVGQQQAKVLNAQVAKQQAAIGAFQDHYNSLDQERKGFQSDLENNHIDPNQYLGNMGTAAKISTALGMILGGAGAGVLHQENPVTKFLGDQINRDIQAQQANMGKQESLLSANMRQFGNLRDATDMTRIMMNDVVGNQLKAAAARSSDPMAKARAQQAIGQIETQAAPIMSQIAMRKTLLGGQANGAVAPEQVVRMVIPEKEQPAAYKELKEAQGMQRSKDNILGAFDKIAQMQTLGNRVTSPIQSTSQINALKDPIIAGLSKETAGRFTESDAKMLGTLFPTVTDNPQTVQLKRAQVMKTIGEKMNFPTLKAWGIDMNKFGRFNQQGQSSIPESAPVR